MSNIFYKNFGVHEVKEVEGEERTFTGIASTGTPDRVQDILIPTGAKFTLPIPLLLHHDLESPVGHVIEAWLEDNQIRVKFTIVDVKEDGELKKIVDKAYQSLKYGLITGLSVGFVADLDEAYQIENGGIEFHSWEWYELSLVTVPCNRDASIDKSIAEHKKSSCKEEIKQVKSNHVVVKLGKALKSGVKI